MVRFSRFALCLLEAHRTGAIAGDLRILHAVLRPRQRGDSVLQVWTIGHSNHSYDRFRDLLREADITTIADVRTAPFSRRFPHFNADKLCASLLQDGIAYVSFGKQLGGRPASRGLTGDGVADYEAMATTKEFREGLNRVTCGAHRHRIALMCAEQNPLDCHRCLLIGRALSQRGVQVNHLLADGRTMSHIDIEQELLGLMGRDAEDLLMSRDQRLAAAYRARARKVASQRRSAKTSELVSATSDNLAGR